MASPNTTPWVLQDGCTVTTAGRQAHGNVSKHVVASD
jgi:hypothetical protein